MSAAARKARKREGVKFVRTPKVGTPLADRSVPWSTRLVGGVRKFVPSSKAIARNIRRSEITGESMGESKS